jgi:uncharacterized membrane protein
MQHEEGGPLADFVAITFDTADEAEAALRTIRGIESAGKIHLRDTAAVRKDADGKVTVHNELASGTEAGIAVGAVLGGVILAVFPIAGIVGGALAGGLIGRAMSPGVDDSFVKEVGDDLPTGGSALFLQISEGDPEVLVGALRMHHGRVRQTSLPDELEQAIDGSPT